MDSSNAKQLEYITLSSAVNPSFWSKLSELKLDVDKLNETSRNIWGYSNSLNSKCSIPLLEVDSTSFNVSYNSQGIQVPFYGMLVNKNTVDQFKECDKIKFLDDCGSKIIDSIINDGVLEVPSILNHFAILSFIDLKKFNFYYWFAFPVPCSIPCLSAEKSEINLYFDEKQQVSLMDDYSRLDVQQRCYFLVRKSGELYELRSKLRDIEADNVTDFFFAFSDISSHSDYPGTNIRNYILLLLHYCRFLSDQTVKFLSFRIHRNKDSNLSCSKSVIFNIKMPKCDTDIRTFVNSALQAWIGWEKNDRGKLGSKVANMKNYLDPKQLAENSVDLNLKLMKWRLLPNIDLDIIKSTKFLLFGSGTLGCSVARILMGWGARHLTFLDNSTVSYSNPVRQSLFTFEDSKLGKSKSQAAADNVKLIFPGVNSRAVQITVPMPGHPLDDSTFEQTKNDVETIANEIREHDVIFLLMDTRESRWLPTMLGANYDKIVINAALGFDSYLVMRHGMRVTDKEHDFHSHPEGIRSLKASQLGCYFCNDVTAPGDSSKDRTLDQQCTVARPGVSAIAGALAAELAVSLLQHKLKGRAPAFYQVGNDLVGLEKSVDDNSLLGLLPHSIRGHLSAFSHVLPATQKYHQCIACSEIVLKEYNEKGFQFLVDVFRNVKHLENITGITEICQQLDEIEIFEYSEDEEM